MHYRFAKREASQRKGRQIIATLQAAGWEGTRSGSRTITPHECETRGLNFSFAIKATSPILVVSETPVLLRAPFTGHIAERRENYAEIMVLIMGQQVAEKLSQSLHTRRRERPGDARPVVPCPLAPLLVRALLHPAPPPQLQRWRVSFLNRDMFRLLGKSFFFSISSPHFIKSKEIKEDSSRLQRIQRWQSIWGYGNQIQGIRGAGS